MTVNIKLSDVSYLPIEEVVKIKPLNEFTNYYIRGRVKPEAVAEKKEALRFQEGDKTRYQVIEPIIVYRDEKNNIFAINGNTRCRALIELYNGKFDKAKTEFQPVPTVFLESEPTSENLLALQFRVNDNTDSHGVLERARTIDEYYEERKAYWIKQRKPAKEAGRLATSECQALDENRSAAYIGQLKKINSIVKNNTAITEFIENDTVSCDTLIKIEQKAKKAKIDFNEAWNQIREQNPNQPRVTPKLVNDFFVSLNTENPQESGSTGGSKSDSSSPKGSRNSAVPSLQEVTKNFVDVLAILPSLTSDLANQSPNDSANIIKELYRLLVITHDDFSVNSSPDLITSICSLVLMRFESSSVDELVSDEKKRNQIAKMLTACQKSISKLHTPPKAEVIEVPKINTEVTLTDTDRQLTGTIS